MSNLVRHAEYELRKAGFYKKSAMYGGLIPQAVMALVRAHASQGHSGGSHALTIAVFEKVINFKTLTPITSNPREWQDISKWSGRPCWQSKRDPAVFSEDAGRTWYMLGDKRRSKTRARR